MLTNESFLLGENITVKRLISTVLDGTELPGKMFLVFSFRTEEVQDKP